MNASVVAPAIETPTVTTRIRSIDIFRGLTMLVMIFVNDLAGIKGLPWWTYHMEPHKSGMTYVDVVFPAFLFALGMSIPLAVEKRLEQGTSMFRLWIHILMRSVSLIVIGLVLANAEKADPVSTHLPAGSWPLLALIGAILFWLVYPSAGGRQVLYRVLKFGGLALLIAMLAIFRRRAPSGEIAWLDFSYWEILGLIGRVYLAACILYIPLRKKSWAPMALFIGLTALSVATRLGMQPLLSIFPYWLWPFDSGELPSIAMAGIVTSSIFLGKHAAGGFRRKALWASAFAAMMFAVGWAFSYLGIHKNEATPTWCLYSSGISVVIFLAIYWLADVRRWRRWAAFTNPAGSNTLFTYLLPDLWYYALMLFGVILPWGQGWPGVARSVVFTGFILGVSFLLTARKIRMQL